MRIFITGGNGFIGRHLVPKLISKKHKLLLLDRKTNRTVSQSSRSITFLKGDLANINTWKSKLKRFKPDVVIHLAWEGLGPYDFSPKTSLKNLTNSLNLISLATEIGCKKFFSLGSCWEYGALGGKLKESSAQKVPTHVPSFVFAKRTIQSFGEQIALEGKMQFLWARLFFAYGPGQKSRAIIPYLIKCFQNKTIPEIKNKTGANDFVYVEDVVGAIIKILEKTKTSSAIYNIGSGCLTSVAQVANLVAQNFKKKPFIQELKKLNGIYADISKIRREIGWYPKTDIVKGVQKTVEYYKSNG